MSKATQKGKEDSRMQVERNKDGYLNRNREIKKMSYL